MCECEALSDMSGRNLQDSAVQEVVRRPYSAIHSGRGLLVSRQSCRSLPQLPFPKPGQLKVFCCDDLDCGASGLEESLERVHWPVKTGHTLSPMSSKCAEQHSALIPTWSANLQICIRRDKNRRLRVSGQRPPQRLAETALSEASFMSNLCNVRESVAHGRTNLLFSWRSYYQEPNWIMNGDQNGEKKNSYWSGKIRKIIWIR